MTVRWYVTLGPGTTESYVLARLGPHVTFATGRARDGIRYHAIQINRH